MATLPYEKITLANRVRLLMIPMDGVNSVATSVMVAVGSRYEQKEWNGISHFLEHMVFKGTEKYPTTEDVNTIERAGGLQNAYTDIDITNYHNKVIASDWELALDINKELAVHPRLEETYADKERDVIIEELKRYEDEPSAKVSETFHGMMYPGTKLGRPIIGTVQSLHAVAAKELHAYHDQWYTPDRLVVVLAGKPPTHQSDVEAKVASWFGGLKGQSLSDIQLVRDEQREPNLKVVTKPDAAQAHLTMGVRLFNRDSEDRFAWSLFNLIMGVSFTSRLFKEVREKRGLCYHIRSSADTWKDVGYWSIYAGVATDKVEETVKAVMAELAKVADKGVTSEEVRVAKKRLKTMLAFRMEDPEFMGEYYGRQELYDQPIITLDEYMKIIDGITKTQIDTLVPKYIRQETLNLALVWNKPRDEKLLSLLKL